MVDLVDWNEVVELQVIQFNWELDCLIWYCLQESLGIDVLFEQVVYSFSILVGVVWVSIWVFDCDYVELGCVCFYDQVSDEILLGVILKVQDYLVYFNVFWILCVVNVDDVFNDLWISEFFKGYFDEFGIMFMLDIQILDCDGLCGVVCCEYVGLVWVWMAEECVFVVLFGDFVGLLMEMFECEKIFNVLEQLNERLVEVLVLMECVKVEVEVVNWFKMEFLVMILYELWMFLNGIFGSVFILCYDISLEVLECWLGVID